MFYFFFFFSSRRRHTRCSRDWSSDVCSSDLDSVSAVSNSDGFFVLRASALKDGVVHGHLRVSAPPPHASYTVPVISLRSEERRVGKEGRSRLVTGQLKENLVSNSSVYH